jgi:hypothetical protein
MFMDLTRGEIPEGAELPKKQFLTEEQLLELWETRGLKYRIDEFHSFCIQRGLLPVHRKDVFRKKVMGILHSFLVEGDFRRDPRFVPPLKVIKRV